MATVQEKIDRFHEKLAKIEMGGGQDKIDKQHEKGKQTARERLNKLFDAGSFTEISQFIRHRSTNFNMQEKEIPGDGVVTGYGTVDGRLVYAYAEDFTVEGGSLGEMHAHKICQVQEMALKMGAPCIGINDSGGARIQEGVDALAGFGRIFMNNTSASGVIPQISVIMGPCAGGAVYSPALTDFIFMVKNTSNMFITGPAVIKSVTAEEVTAEELGGAVTHHTVSGVAHFACETEDDCIAQIKRLLSYLPSNNMEEPPMTETNDDPNRTDEGLNSIVPDNSNMPYDMLDVIKSTVDDGDVYEVLKNYAQNIITCFARYDGQTVGIIANQPKFLAGCLDINASDKAARFIRMCDSFNIPLVTFVDVPGFFRNSAVLFVTARRCFMRIVKRRCRKLRSSYARLTAEHTLLCVAVSWEPIWSLPGRRRKLPLWVLTEQPILFLNETKIRKPKNRLMWKNLPLLTRRRNTVMWIVLSSLRKHDLALSMPLLCYTASGKNGRLKSTAIFPCKEAS